VATSVDLPAQQQKH